MAEKNRTVSEGTDSELKPKSGGGRKYLRLFIISGIIILLDQVSKAAVMDHLRLYESIPVIGGFFDLIHIQNPGGAFGFLADQGPVLRVAVFLFASSVAVCLILYFYIHTPETHPFLATGLALIFGGAVGNMIDRFRFGQVVDFIDLYIGQMHWPAFNVADSAVTVGICIFVYHLVLNKIPK